MRKRDRDRAERIRLAGGPKPTLRERVVSLVLEKGEARTKDLTDIGIPRCYLARMCDEGLLVKVGYGRYCAATSRLTARQSFSASVKRRRTIMRLRQTSRISAITSQES
jgi:hypothetical protein